MPVTSNVEPVFQVAVGIDPPLTLCTYVAPDAKESVPQLFAPKVVLVIIPLFTTSVVGEVTVKVLGTVKLHAFVPSPTTIFEPVPETVHEAPIVGVELLRILKVEEPDVKFSGAEPLPSVLVPQLLVDSKFPDDLL